MNLVISRHKGVYTSSSVKNLYTSDLICQQFQLFYTYRLPSSIGRQLISQTPILKRSGLIDIGCEAMMGRSQ